MKKILIITGRYLPGYKDGGPVRTIKNLTDMLGDDYSFTIACADRDHGDTKQYDGIKSGIDGRNRVGKADVVYIENGKYSFSDILKLSKINDIVYICGPYNGYAIKSLILKRIGKISCPLVLAPMGSFSKGALAIRSKKKQIFLSVFKILGFFNNIYFSVTSEVEKEEMKSVLNKNKELISDDKIFIAEDPQRKTNTTLSNKTYRKNNKLNVVFLSRISEKKNLYGAAQILSNVKGNVCFDVYGNMEDEEYYTKCLEVISEFPSNVNYKYMGEAASEDVPKILSKYDVFLFPTHGENFGHVISEALSAGVIPVISDTTPWLDFNDKNCGFVISHDDLNMFSECIDKLCDMPIDELKEISRNAIEYYKQKYDQSYRNNGYKKIFDMLT